MQDISILPQRGRLWLPVRYGKQEVRFAYPPVQGTHKECFTAINKDAELRPAEGLELALLTFGAYTSQKPEWKDIRQNCFVSNYTRIPNRLLLIPAGHIESDASLSGVLIERDVKGIGLTKKMQVPDLAKGWKEIEGVYRLISSEIKAVFVPSSAYQGKSFKQDRIVHAHFTPEGAELFAKTAKDAGKNLYDWIAQRVNEITAPEQRVSLFYGNSGRLDLYSSRNDNRDDRAFGVFASAKV